VWLKSGDPVGSPDGYVLAGSAKVDGATGGRVSLGPGDFRPLRPTGESARQLFSRACVRERIPDHNPDLGSTRPVAARWTAPGVR